MQLIAHSFQEWAARVARHTERTGHKVFVPDDKVGVHYGVSCTQCSDFHLTLDPEHLECMRSLTRRALHEELLRWAADRSVPFSIVAEEPLLSDIDAAWPERRSTRWERLRET